MATFNKSDAFVRDLVLGVHNLSTHSVMATLTNEAILSTDSVKADFSELSAVFGFTAGGKFITNVVSATGGITSVGGTDVVWSAIGNFGPFRYVVLYNDTPTAPADPLIGWYDYGSSLNLIYGDTFTVDFGTSIFTLT